MAGKYYFLLIRRKLLLKRFNMKKDLTTFNEEKSYKSLVFRKRKAMPDSSMILF